MPPHTKKQRDEIARRNDSPYYRDAYAFICKHNISFHAELMNPQRCPAWCLDGTHMHGNYYTITFRRSGRNPFVLEYWGSRYDKELNVAPTVYDVLTCIEKNEPELVFENWIKDLGYDELRIVDYPRIRSTHDAILKQWQDVKHFFTADEITELQDIN